MDHRGLPSGTRRMHRILFWLLLCSTPAIADPPDPPLAVASDIEFTVDYSTDKLRLGDALLAQVSIKNKSDHAVRISDFHALVIRAKTPTATQLAVGFGEYPGGTTLQKLAPGEAIVFEVDLDVFSDDANEDGTFDPFDSGLTGQKVAFHATCSTLMAHTRGDHNLDCRDCRLQHSQVIEFGQPLIGRKPFDDAVAEMRKRDDLKNPKGYVGLGRQRSYLFTKTDDLRRWSSGRRTSAAMFHVHLERLPAESSLRRSASMTLAVNGYVAAESILAEERAISEILSLLGQFPRIERAYWKSSIRRLLASDELRIRGVISKQKAELLSSRIPEDK